MSILDPLVLPVADRLSVTTPGVPEICRGHVWERSRFEWRASDGGDPAALLVAYLAGLGLPVADLLGPAARDARLRHERARRERDGLCGAALFVSAAAAAVMTGAAPGAASPVPAVPDVVAVEYRHGPPPEVPAPRPPAARRRAPAERWRLDPWVDTWTGAEHAAAVRQVRAAIGRGDVYQVNVVGHASAGYHGDPGPALRRVAGLPGARYGGVLSGSGWAIACASPETLLELACDRLRTRPIKGTRPATVAGRAELLASDKERAEHVMIVDLVRNDLSRVARTGSVRVEQLYAVRRWCDLWQAESTVGAQLTAGVGLADLLRAVCPGGSVTGAPKRAALGEIAVLEPTGRGASMGALGWIGPDRLDLGLTIRTVAVDARRVHVWAGGGITWGSDPRAEVDEARAKAGPVRAALAGPLTSPANRPADRWATPPAAPNR